MGRSRLGGSERRHGRGHFDSPGAADLPWPHRGGPPAAPAHFCSLRGADAAAVLAPGFPPAQQDRLPPAGPPDQCDQCRGPSRKTRPHPARPAQQRPAHDPRRDHARRPGPRPASHQSPQRGRLHAPRDGSSGPGRAFCCAAEVQAGRRRFLAGRRRQLSGARGGAPNAAAGSWRTAALNGPGRSVASVHQGRYGGWWRRSGRRRRRCRAHNVVVEVHSGRHGEGRR